MSTDNILETHIIGEGRNKRYYIPKNNIEKFVEKLKNEKVK